MDRLNKPTIAVAATLALLVSGAQNPPPYGESRDHSHGAGDYFVALAAALAS